jgi:Retrotransposon gag protein/Zinc knuckle
MSAEEVLAQLQQQNAELYERLQLLSATVTNLQQQPVSAAKAKPRKPNDFYGGGKDLPAWLYSVELYCHSTGIVDERQMIQVAMPYLSGAAAIWLRKYCPPGEWTKYPWSTWKEFCTALRTAFGVLEEHQHARDRLDQLRQKRTQSIDDYVTEYRSLQLELPDVTDDELIYRFRKTLYWDKVREYITQGLVGKDSKDLSFEDVAVLAVNGEHQLIGLNQRNRNNSAAGGQNWQPRYPAPSTPAPRPVAMDIGNINSQPVSRDALFREGRCFYCKERGHRKADCPELKKKQGNGGRRQ